MRDRNKLRESVREKESEWRIVLRIVTEYPIFMFLNSFAHKVFLLHKHAYGIARL